MDLLQQTREIVREQAKDSLYELMPEHSQGAVMRGKIIELKRDHFHFIVHARKIMLQISVKLTSDGVLATTFASPRVITKTTRAAFVALANELNLQEATIGRFFVDNLDFAYQAFCPASLLQAAPWEARKSLFEDGVRILSSVAVPIYGIAKDEWPAEKACMYVNQLYDDGFVYDDEYFK